MIEELSYSFHIGNDKNKTSKAKQISKERPTNFNNNAIQNGIQLSKVNHHNLRIYENNPELIYTIKGSNNLVNDTKKLYLELFEESRINYNNKQTRDDRKIDNYFNKIANDNKHDLAVEIIIELGNMYYWSDKTMEEKYKMINVFEKQVIDLEKLIPSFKVVNATIHFDESSPHLHIVGVPVKENCKTGMNKQVGKSDVFNVESLKDIQKELRESCINEFNRVYNLNMELKEKEQGRNQDYRVSQMKDYDIFQRNYNKQQKKIQKVNSKTEVINKESKDLKEIINNLKQQPLNKNNVLLSNENKDKIIKYIEDIESNNKTIKSLTNYSLAVDKIKEDFEENHNSIEDLRKIVKAQNEEIKDLRNDLDNKDNEISFLKSKIEDLKDTIDYWKDKFQRVVKFIHDKIHGIFGDKDDKYKEIADNLFINGIMDEKEYTSFINKKEKNNDDYER